MLGLHQLHGDHQSLVLLGVYHTVLFTLSECFTIPTSYNSLSLTSHNPLRHRVLTDGQVDHPLFKMSLILIATSEANPNCEGVQSVTL